MYLLFFKKDKQVNNVSKRIHYSKNKNLEKLEKSLKNEKQKLIKIRKYIEKNFEYVGKNFSKKVREIYYDKNSKKTIYGSTTPEERRITRGRH